MISEASGQTMWMPTTWSESEATITLQKAFTARLLTEAFMGLHVWHWSAARKLTQSWART